MNRKTQAFLSSGPCTSPPKSFKGDSKVIAWDFFIGLATAILVFLTAWGTDNITEENFGIYAGIIAPMFFFLINLARRWLADNESTSKNTYVRPRAG